jgi:hypothetical protein
MIDRRCVPHHPIIDDSYPIINSLHSVVDVLHSIVNAGYPIVDDKHVIRNFPYPMVVTVRSYGSDIRASSCVSLSSLFSASSISVYRSVSLDIFLKRAP